MKLPQTEQLLNVISRLRQECPWDKKQTHQSLAPYVIEEAYEVVDAIVNKDADQICDELGDLLLQIALHAEIASESGGFDFEAVAKGLSGKMIERHPHIFKDTKDITEAEHLQNWEKAKSASKRSDSALDGVMRSFPSLVYAQKISVKAAKVGFDWEAGEQVLDKVDEELREVKAEIQAKRTQGIESEIGDLLFTIVNLARHYKIDSDVALRKSTEKFVRRFQQMEKGMANKKLEFKSMSFDEMNIQWDLAKKETEGK